MAEPFSRETAANRPDLSPPIPASRELPIASDTTADLSGEPEGEKRMVEVAERIGGALGSAVNRARRLEGEVRTRLRVVEGQGRAQVRSASDAAQSMAHSVGERITEISRQAGQNASQMREQLKTDARERVTSWRESAQEGAADLRRRAGRIREHSPLQALAVLGVAAFLIGASLRIWRSRRG